MNTIVAFQTTSCLLFVEYSDVLRFDFLPENIWSVTLTDHKRYKLRRQIVANDLVKLNSMYLQVSKTCIVNAIYIAFIENKTLFCVMHHPFEAYRAKCSRFYYSQIKDKFALI
jgi:hypothetical protein